VTLANLLDELHDRGFDSALRAGSLVPLPRSASEAGKDPDTIVGERLALLEGSPALRKWYFDAPDPITMYGLPTSAVEDFGDALAIRTQRAVLLEWKVDMPWAQAGEITIANAGQIAAQLGAFPMGAIVPEPAPVLPPATDGGPSRAG
jgi:hypothetical protein